MEAQETPSGVPEAKAKCKKCLKPYLRGGKWLDAHEATCDGTPWDPSKTVPRTPRKDSPPPPPPPPPTPLEGTLRDLERAKAETSREIELVKSHLERLQKEETALGAAIQKLVEAKSA